MASKIIALQIASNFKVTFAFFVQFFYFAAKPIMKVVIFAGGLGTRLAEETDVRPKPMVEIGGKPILWHIMKIYSSFGFNEFVVCLGYKGYFIKEYFIQYYLHNSDITIGLQNNKMDVHYTNAESFTVTLVDTGVNTKTAGRLKKITTLCWR